VGQGIHLLVGSGDDFERQGQVGGRAGHWTDHSKVAFHGKRRHIGWRVTARGCQTEAWLVRKHTTIMRRRRNEPPISDPSSSDT
jgi:hypothetical protein